MGLKDTSRLWGLPKETKGYPMGLMHTQRLRGHRQGFEGYPKGSMARAQVHTVFISIFWVDGLVCFWTNNGIQAQL